VHNPEDEPKIFAICKEWETRNNFTLGYERYTKIIQRDVNNYIFVGKDYTVTKGAVVKRLSKLDNDLPIVNRAVVDYFVKGTDPRKTIYSSDKLIDFQKVTKISNKYEYGFHELADGEVITLGENTYRGNVLHEKVIRCFASTNPNHGTIYKKHKKKETLDKTASTPERAFIDNGDITDKLVPDHLDREFYVELAKRRISEFVRS